MNIYMLIIVEFIISVILGFIFLSFLEKLKERKLDKDKLVSWLIEDLIHNPH